MVRSRDREGNRLLYEHLSVRALINSLFLCVIMCIACLKINTFPPQSNQLGMAAHPVY